MSKRRERAKAPAVKLSKQLAAAEIVKRNHVENQKKNLRYADILTDLAKLVFGGVIIGGVFENMEHPFFLYSIGFGLFFLLLWTGNKYYIKGIKEI